MYAVYFIKLLSRSDVCQFISPTTFPVESGVNLEYRIVSFLKLRYHLKNFVISMRLKVTALWELILGMGTWRM